MGPASTAQRSSAIKVEAHALIRGENPPEKDLDVLRRWLDNADALGSLILQRLERVGMGRGFLRAVGAPQILSTAVLDVAGLGFLQRRYEHGVMPFIVLGLVVVFGWFVLVLFVLCDVGSVAFWR